MLEDKIKSYLDDGMPYEALMYIQSFIARKKKKSPADTALFNEALTGVKLFQQYNHFEYAGTLVDWTLESGTMHLDLTSGHLNQLLTMIETLPQQAIESYLFISKFFLKLRKAVSAQDRDAKSSDLSRLCACCGPLFFHAQRWRQAIECSIITGSAGKMCEIIDVWANTADSGLYPLFFVRVYLYLLSKEEQLLANEFMDLATGHVKTSVLANSTKGVCALWHFVCMTNDLTLLTIDIHGRPVNKAAIFMSLWEYYSAPLKSIDEGLVPLVESVAVKQFKIRPKQSASPFSMIQSLFNA